MRLIREEHTLTIAYFRAISVSGLMTALSAVIDDADMTAESSRAKDIDSV